MKQSIILAGALVVVMAGCTATDKTVKNTINQEEVMAKMSLEDKAHFVIGTGMQGFSGDEAVIGATKNLVPGAAGTTYPLDSLGIPAIVLADGPAGLRIDATRTSPLERCSPRHGTLSWSKRWVSPWDRR